MQALQTYRGTPGEHISSAAATACDMASDTAATVYLEFNDVRVPVRPDHTPDDVVAIWQRGMDEAAEAYRTSPAGQKAAAEAEGRRIQAQADHDAAMATLPETFVDARAAISWLKTFGGPADHVGILGADFDRVADVLERSGWSDGEASGRPEADYAEADLLGRWIIGQAINMLRRGNPPHPMLTHTFSTRFLEMAPVS